METRPIEGSSSERWWPRQRYCFHSRRLYYCSLPPHFPQIRWYDARTEPFLPSSPVIPLPPDSHTVFPAVREDRDVTMHELHEINLPFDGKRVVLKVLQGMEWDYIFILLSFFIADRGAGCIYFTNLLYCHSPTTTTTSSLSFSAKR